MENSLQIKDDEKMSTSSSWQMGLLSTKSSDTQGSRMSHQQNLKILKKKETPHQGMIIPATLHEKLTYYRTYVSFPYQSDINPVRRIPFNKFIWYYVLNMFCKSLPSTYVYVFLGVYAPEDHFFIPKMVPMCYGCIWSNILASFMALVIHKNGAFLLWDYVYHGLFWKNPWNRCTTKSTKMGNITVTCYEVAEFKQKVFNKTLAFNTSVHGYSIGSDPEVFQVAPFFFYRWRSQRTAIVFAFDGMLLLIAALLYKQMFKKYMWKILFYTHWTLNFMTLATFVHLTLYYFTTDFDNMERKYSDPMQGIWGAGLNSPAESMTASTTVHILTARGTDKVMPSSHSTIIIASNTIYFFFIGLQSYMMKKYCEHFAGAPLKVTIWTVESFYCLWTIYFSYFYLGDIYTIIFFLLHAITELIVITITFNCLVEAIGKEWRWMRRSFIAIGLSALGFILSYLQHYYRHIVLQTSLHIFSTAAATFAETTAIYLLYPLGRLVDDITFHYGTPPTTLRVFNLRTVPLFQAIKLYIVVIRDIFDYKQAHRCIVAYCYYRYMQIIPFVLGSLYAIYKTVYRNKQAWKQLFVPLPEWGPKDFRERQLRKQYDSRQYIGSQAPRDLSRYFIEKAELKTHKLDIQYDFHSGFFMQSEVWFEEEKKSV